MKIIFLTNQASYHQMDFARAMASRLGDDSFRIVFQKPTSAARAEMGWQDDFTEPYILRFWESQDTRAQVLRWIAEADVVIQGRFPISLVRERIKQGRLTFACQERLWKKPPSVWRKISRFPHLYKNYYSVNKPNYHFLAIGAYAAEDLNQMGIFRGRTWRYGYFMALPDCPVRSSSQTGVKLVWCARFSPVKQPISALEIVQALKTRGLDVSLTMIGDGELRTDIEKAIIRRGLQSSVTLTGWLPNSEVIQRMRESDLFLMTSHHGEGWGMVVNEAMSHGCCVLANQQLGSAKWLIEHGKNGFLYDQGSLTSVLDELAALGHDKIQALGQRAYQSMQSGWCSSEAAQRTLALSQQLLTGDTAGAKTLYPSGLCSWVN